MKHGVLIVEDEGIVAMEIQDYLEGLGYPVVAVTNSGESAAEIAREKSPDLILMDVRLKGQMDGIKAAAKIREHRTVPIIFITAYSGDETLKRAKVTEPYAYLVKPIDESQLRSAIEIAMYKYLRDSETSASLTSLSAVLRSLPSAVVVANRQQSVVYMNRTAEELLNKTLADVRGRDLSEVVVFKDGSIADASGSGLSSVLSEGASLTLEGKRLVSSAGEAGEFGADVGLAPLRRREGGISGIICTLKHSGSSRSHGDARLSAQKAAGNDGPLIQEPEQLRDFLEVEIVRLMLEAESGEAPLRHSIEGQIAAYQNLLRLMFGRAALRTFLESVPSLPATT